MGRRNLSLVLLLAGLCLGADSKLPPREAASSRSAPAGTGEIRGAVRNHRGEPVENATVAVVAIEGETSGAARPPKAPGRGKPLLVTTRKDGSFVVSNLVGRAFAVRVEAPGLAPFFAREIPPGASLTIHLKPGVGLRGRVLDRTTRSPIAGATVEATVPNEARFGLPPTRRATTNEDGRFDLRDLAPGTVNLVAFSRRHARGSLASVPVPTPPAPDGSAGPEPVLLLGPGGRLSGRVLLPDGKPAVDATVLVFPKVFEFGSWRKENLLEAPTDEAGRFVLEGIPAGSDYSLAVRKAGYPPAEPRSYRIEPGTDIGEIEIRLEAGATLRLRLVDQEGTAVEGADFALIEAAPEGGASVFGGRRVVSDEEIEKGPGGSFTLRGLPAGKFTLRIVPSDFDEIERDEVTLRPGETTDLGTILVRATAGIAGRVTDRAGEPIAGAEVGVWYRAEGTDLRSRTVKTRSDGRWRIPGTGDGRILSLWATARGYARQERRDLSPADQPFEFALERASRILGRVQFAEGGSPPEFAVRVERETGEEDVEGFPGMVFEPSVAFEQSFTDPGGSFRLEDIAPGSYTLIVRAAGRAPARRTGLAVGVGRDAEAGTILLFPGRKLRGSVVALSDHSPIAGAAIQALLPHGTAFPLGPPEMGPSALSGPDGRFVLEGLEAGAYIVTASHGEFASSETRVEIPSEGEPEEVVLELGRGGRLEGTVRDGRGQPVSGAMIGLLRGPFDFADARFAETGSDGRYRFERVAPGSYSLSRFLERPGVGPGTRVTTKTATVSEGATTVVDFGEEPRVRLSGRVLKGGKPVGRAALFFTPAGQAPFGSFATATSDDHGGYDIELDSGGSYVVVVRPPDMEGGPAAGGPPIEIRVPDTAQAYLDLVLPAPGISGRITDAAGQPVSQAFVVAVREGAGPNDPSGRAYTETGASGSYAIESLPAGTYRVTASAPGYRIAEAFPVIVQEGATPPVNFVLEPGRTLRGKVVDPGGRPVPNALVFVAPAGSSEGVPPADTTDANGEFSVTAPSEGALDLTAIVKGWAPARATGLVVSGEPEETPVVLTIREGGRLRIQVLGASNEPVPNAPIRIHPKPPFPGAEVAPFLNPVLPTGPDGVTVASYLAPGSYEVALPDRPVPSATATVSEGAETTVTIRLP